MKQKNNIITTIIKIIVLVILIAVLALKAVEIVELTRDTAEIRNQLLAQGDLDESERALIDEWDDIMLDRIVNYGMCLVWYAIVFLFVAKVGPAQKTVKHISKEEANEIMMAMEAQYRADGSYVDKVEEDEEETEFMPESLETPVLISAISKGSYIEVSWESVLYADGYTIYRRTEESKWKRIGRTTMENTVYQDYSLAANTRYIYSVKAFLVSEDKKIVSRKDPLGKDAVSTCNNLPDVPEIFPIDEDGRKGIGWKPVDGVKVYRIFRTKNGKKWKQAARVVATEGCKYFPEPDALNSGFNYSVSAAIVINKHPVIGEHDSEGIAL